VGRSDLGVGFGGEAGVGGGGGPVPVEEAVVEGSGKVRHVDFDGSVGLLKGGLGSDLRAVVGEEEEEGEGKGEEKGGE
jgi:hypothetical protein